MIGPRGLQRLAANPPPPRAIVVGQRWDPACTQLRQFLDRPDQLLWLRRTPGRRRVSGGGRCLPADSPVIRFVGGETVVRPELRRVADCSGSAPSLRPTIRHDGHRRGPVGSRGRRVRRVRRVRTLVVDGRRRADRPAHRLGSRNTSASRRRLRRRARQPGAAAGAPPRRRDPGDANDHAIDAETRRCTSTVATCSVRGRSSWPAAFLAAVSRSTASSGWSARASSTAPPAARRRTSRARHPHRRRRELGGAGGDVLLKPRT